MARPSKPKTVTIVINGRAKPWPKNEDITFEQVVALEFPARPAAMVFSLLSSTHEGAATNRPGPWSRASRQSEGRAAVRCHAANCSSPDLQKLQNEGYDLDIRGGLPAPPGLPYYLSPEAVATRRHL